MFKLFHLHTLRHDLHNLLLVIKSYAIYTFLITNSPVWLGGSILFFYIFDYTSRILF